MMGTQATVGVDIPTPALDLIEDKDVDLATPPGEETWEQLSDTRLFILGVAFFALWAGNASSVLQTSTILPVIQKEFGVSKSQVQWVAASNTIVWGSSQIIAGRCCDIYGRKRALHCGMVLFILPNLLSTFMPNLAALNVCRGFVGAGAAVLIPAAAGMIGSIYPPGRKRTFAFIAISCGGVSGASVGMLIAGAFVEYSRWTWRPCYLVIALVSLGPWAVITWLVPVDPPNEIDTRLDWIGSFLMGVSLFLLLFGFSSSQTEKRGWATPYVPVLIGGSVIFMICFVSRQIQLTKALASGTKAKPLIPRSLLSLDCWDLLVIYVAAVLIWACGDTMWALLSYLYLDVMDLGAFESGLRLSTVLFSGLAAASVVALTINRVPPRLLMSASCGVSVISLVLLAVSTQTGKHTAEITPTNSVVAAGLTIISKTARIKDGSIATAIFQTSCRIGYAIGMAVATLIQVNVESRALRSDLNDRDALAKGLSVAFWFCGTCAASGALVILFGMRGWQMLSEMKQGGEEQRDPAISPADPRSSASV